MVAASAMSAPGRDSRIVVGSDRQPKNRASCAGRGHVYDEGLQETDAVNSSGARAWTYCEGLAVEVKLGVA